MPLPLLPELLLELLPGLRYAEVQRLRRTCRYGQTVPYAPTLAPFVRAFRKWRQRRIWRHWRALRRTLLLTDNRCHCGAELDIPHLFEMRVRIEPQLYTVYHAFCTACWCELCRQWPGPFTPPAEWTCEQTQHFVHGEAGPRPPRPAPAPRTPPPAAGAPRSAAA